MTKGTHAETQLHGKEITDHPGSPDPHLRGSKGSGMGPENIPRGGFTLNHKTDVIHYPIVIDIHIQARGNLVENRFNRTFQHELLALLPVINIAIGIRI